MKQIKNQYQVRLLPIILLLLLILSVHLFSMGAAFIVNVGAVKLLSSSSNGLDAATYWLLMAHNIQDSKNTLKLLGRVEQAKGNITSAMQVWRKEDLKQYALDVATLELAVAPADEAKVWEMELRALVNQPIEWFKFGVALEQRGEYERATEAYLRTINHEVSDGVATNLPSQSEVYYRLAGVYRRQQNQLQATISAYSNAVLAGDFRNAWHQLDAYQQLAILLLSSDAEQAVQSASRAVELMPGNAMSHSILGLALFAAYGDLAQAEQEVQAGIRLDPNNVWPRMHLGQLYYRAKQYEQAESVYRTTATLHPQFQEAKDMADFIRSKYLGD